MGMNATILRALEYARASDFQRCRDMLYDFEPLSKADEDDLNYAWGRLEELES